MSCIINSSLSILLVDDSEFKIEKVKLYFSEVTPDSKVEIARDQISAQKHLLSEKYDLLILDMQIPYRHGETEPQEDGGILLLEEIEIGEGYIQPTRIVVFTQFEKLQDSIREKYPELGAIFYDLTSDSWKPILLRTLVSLSKSKKN